MAATRPRIAIVGAGICGLRLAQRLGHTAEVTVFEKSRGFGGRMSTRRADPFQFDHGAQYMTAHGAAFRDFLAPHLGSGLVRRWSPRLAVLGDGAPCVWSAPRYVAVPGMSALGRAMAEGVDVRREARVDRLAAGVGWTLEMEDGAVCEGFDWVLAAVPGVQAARLLPAQFAARAALDDVRMRGCFSLMIGLDTDPDLPWDAAVVRDGPLAWIAADHRKPGRQGQASILCQSTVDWAEANLERDPERVRDELLSTVAALAGIDAARAPHLSLHRWRYSYTERPAPEPCLLDAAAGLGAAGDWCAAGRPGRVETAFDSAEALADRVLSHLG